MSLFTIHIVKPDWTSLELRILYTKLRKTFLDEATHLTHLADARHIAFHVGHEAWHANLAKTLCQHLKGHGFSRTRGSSHKTMTVGHLPDDA